MKEIIVEGGAPLYGAVELSGSKNAALPIIFATVATKGISVISRVPNISDVDVAIEIIQKLGAVVERRGDTLVIDTRVMQYEKTSRELTSKIRASSYLIGACIARFGIFHLSEFGGCNFCNRPIDMHLDTAQKLGAVIEDGVIHSKGLFGAKICFLKKSVGATINALIMALSAEGETVLVGGAKEPHVKNLIVFLRSAGAYIEDIDGNYVIKKSLLKGGEIEVIPDMIEAGTFLLLGSMTGGNVTIREKSELELNSFFSTVSNAGIKVQEAGGVISFSGSPNKNFSVVTAPHPGYPTDLQPQIAPIMAKYFGGTIHENVWQQRFSYLKAIKAFGVNFKVEDSKAYIYPSEIVRAECEASDLRGGAAAVMCALAARGVSKIKNADLIFRGYSDFMSKLLKIGAKVKILN